MMSRLEFGASGRRAKRAGSKIPSGNILSNRSLRRATGLGVAAALLAPFATTVAHADPSLSELAAEIQALKNENRQMRESNREMKAAITEMRGQNRRTSEKVRAVAERRPAGPGYTLPPPGPSTPVGAVPAFVTADKKLLFGSITITPGGFLAAESVFRAKTTQSDINTGYGNIPLNISPLAHLNEWRPTARQSRVALLAEGAITPTLLASAYAEFDFLGAGTTSNATDTNSYAPRIRNLYAQLDSSEYGLHLLAGQNWSLLTLNSKGITPRNEVLPPVIDGQFIPGTTFARQAQVRLVKDFDKKLWLGLSLEEAQTTFGAAAACTGGSLTGTTASGAIAGGAADGAVSTPVGTTVNAICAATGSGAGFSQYGQPYSFDHIPDVIGKVAYEATLGERDIHLEASGIYKNLYDRTEAAIGGVTIPGTGGTHNSNGFGFGAGLIVPVIPRRLDFQGSVLAGRGIGRYGAGLLPDATFNADGSLRPIGEVQALVGATLHATPAIDVYLFAGIEKEQRANTFLANGTQFGYGVTNANNAGCGIEGIAATTCAGVTQTLFQITGGMWDKIYKGSFGELRGGLQYSYTERELFRTQTTPAAASFQPRANDSFLFTSLRYYPFQ